jgi:hypothetical protein
MEQPTHASVDERLRLLAEELSAQRGSADAPEIDERMAYLEEAMSATRLTRPLTSRAANGMTG